MYARYQTVLYLADLDPAFLGAMIEVWSDQGIDAARCFGVGA